MVTSCVLYYSTACEFGMIGMLIMHVLRVEIVRSLECCTTSLLVEKEDYSCSNAEIYTLSNSVLIWEDDPL